MKKYNILIALIIFFSWFGSHAQEGDVYVSIGAGVSIPMGEFAATDFNDESSGFARNGGAFNITFGYRFNDYLSLTGKLNGGVNRYDYVKLQDWLNGEYATIYPNTSWVVETKNWGQGGLLAGFTGSLPLSSNTLYLEARALGGFTYVYSPAINAIGKETNEDDKRIYIDQYSAISWAVDLGAGFRWNRTQKQYFTLYADYLMARPQYNNVETVTENIGSDRVDSFSQQVNAVSICIGLGYIVN